MNSNGSEFGNDSFTFFGPIGMAFYEDGNALDHADSIKITLSIFLAISMVLSIIGNVCTCAVIARDKTMRTPTNFYLFNLAITDLLFSFFVPIEIYIIWKPDFYPFGEEGCRLHFVLCDCVINSNALTIAAFTVERYIVISKPFLRQQMMMGSRVFKILGVIWITSFLFCVPDILYIDLLERKKYVYCYFTVNGPMQVMMAMELLIIFLIPMTIIFVLYVLIAVKLKSASHRLRSSPVNGNQHRDKAVKMLAAVAASFFFCWTPYSVIRIMTIYPDFKYEDYYKLWGIINYLTYNIYLSTVINPILYSLMSHKFRQAFKDFFKGRSAGRRDSLATSNSKSPRTTMTALDLNQKMRQPEPVRRTNPK